MNDVKTACCEERLCSCDREWEVKKTRNDFRELPPRIPENVRVAEVLDVPKNDRLDSFAPKKLRCFTFVNAEYGWPELCFIKSADKVKKAEWSAPDTFPMMNVKNANHGRIKSTVCMGWTISNVVETCGEMPQDGRFVRKFHASEFVTVSVHIGNDLDNIIDMALRLYPAWDG